MNYKLSKSRINEYLQCPKRLYLSIHHPELADESSDLQSRFQIGHAVGDLARRQYADGILIGDEHNNLRQALQQTQQVLRDYPGKPIFEATFQHEDMLIRADLLIPGGKGYRMVEVKSSTRVKDCHLPDCAMQYWVTSNNNVRLTRVSLMHINSGFKYSKLGDYQGFFWEADVTEEVLAQQENIPSWISAGKATLEGGEPNIGPGAHCSTPYECPFSSYCKRNEPEYPVELLPKIVRGQVEALKAQGYADIREVPAGVISQHLLERIRRVTASGQAELDEMVTYLMETMPYPRYYLDFETVNPAIPLWLDTRPYQQIPFQWSCHIEQENGELHHAKFLDISGASPMRAFAETLIETLGVNGAILVYNAGFETGRIRELARRYKDLAPQLTELLERVVDLFPLARSYYYHPAMRGSWSLKAILPTIAPDLDYSQLDEVRHGGSAQAAYLEAIAPGTTDERKEKLKRALLKYCELDTFAMVRLAQFFQSSAPE